MPGGTARATVTDMTGLPRAVPPGALSGPLAGAVLASPESTGQTGIKFVAVLVGIALIWAAIRAMFGRKR